MSATLRFSTFSMRIFGFLLYLPSLSPLSCSTSKMSLIPDARSPTKSSSAVPRFFRCELHHARKAFVCWRWRAASPAFMVMVRSIFTMRLRFMRVPAAHKRG